MSFKYYVYISGYGIGMKPGKKTFHVQLLFN